jgi:hypothetical protein
MLISSSVSASVSQVIMVVPYTYSKGDRWVLVAASDQLGGESKDDVNPPYNTGSTVHFKIRVTTPGVRDPGWVKIQDSDPGSGYRTE